MKRAGFAVYLRQSIFISGEKLTYSLVKPNFQKARIKAKKPLSLLRIMTFLRYCS
jgi:hypothetical protein